MGKQKGHRRQAREAIARDAAHAEDSAALQRAQTSQEPKIYSNGPINPTVRYPNGERPSQSFAEAYAPKKAFSAHAARTPTARKGHGHHTARKTPPITNRDGVAPGSYAAFVEDCVSLADTQRPLDIKGAWELNFKTALHTALSKKTMALAFEDKATFADTFSEILLPELAKAAAKANRQYRPGQWSHDFMLSLPDRESLRPLYVAPLRQFADHCIAFVWPRYEHAPATTPSAAK